MPRSQLPISIFFILCLFVSNLWADSNPNLETSSSPITHIWTNTVDVHAGYNSLYHLGAVGATGLMIATGVDEVVHEKISRDVQGEGTEVALAVGNVWHLGPAAIVYFASDKGSHYEYSSAAVLQALAINAVVTTSQKIITGRRGPSELQPFDLFKRTDDPADFNFRPWQNFDFKEGRFFWPSGHTASAMTTASALAAFYPDKTWLHVTTYTATTWMAYSMVDGSHHWASDIVAGALIGHIIGWTVGKDFRRRYANKNKQNVSPEKNLENSFYWQPMFTGNGYGVKAGWYF